MANGITKEQVYQAADDLDRQGVKPTPTKVREKLGGTGSFSTISAHLKSWESEGRQPDALPAVEDETMRPFAEALREPLAAFLAEQQAAWLKSQEEEREQWTNQQASYLADLGEQAGEIQRLEELLDRAETHNAHLLARLDRLAEGLGPPRPNGHQHPHSQPQTAQKPPEDIPGQLTILEAIEPADWKQTPLCGFISDDIAHGVALFLAQEEDLPMNVNALTVGDWLTLTATKAKPLRKYLSKTAGCMLGQIDQAFDRITRLAKSYATATAGPSIDGIPLSTAGPQPIPDGIVDLMDDDHLPTNKGKAKQTWQQWLTNFGRYVMAENVATIHDAYAKGLKPKEARDLLSSRHGLTAWQDKPTAAQIAAGEDR